MNLFDKRPEDEVIRRMKGATVIKIKPVGAGYNWFEGWFTQAPKVRQVVAQADPSCVGDCLKHCKTRRIR